MHGVYLVVDRVRAGLVRCAREEGRVMGMSWLDDHRALSEGEKSAGRRDFSRSPSSGARSSPSLSALSGEGEPRRSTLPLPDGVPSGARADLASSPSPLSALTEDGSSAAGSPVGERQGWQPSSVSARCGPLPTPLPQGSNDTRALLYAGVITFAPLLGFCLATLTGAGS